MGRRFRPLFPYFAGAANAFVVLAGDFVTTEDGTGIVQMAPGFGEDDQIACAAAGIDVVCPVDSRTRFTSEVPDFEGLQVFEANQPIIRVLRADRASSCGPTATSTPIPHCWRTDTPLVYRAVTSWFVEVTAIKDRLLANNADIVVGPPSTFATGPSASGWPTPGTGRSPATATGAHPSPSGSSDDPELSRVSTCTAASIELEADFGVRPDRSAPARPSTGSPGPTPTTPPGRSTMRRVTDVLDCWFESGSMPYAQVHYPFENREWFDEHYPR